MKQFIEETEEDTQMMTQYGITSETKKVYFLEGFKYDKLADALKYARHSADEGSKSSPI